MTRVLNNSKHLIEYNAIQCEKRNSYRKKVREEKKAQKTVGDTSEVGGAVNGHDAEDGDFPRAPKRARRSSADPEEHVSGSEEEEADGEDQGEDDQQDQEDDEVEEDDEAEGENGEELTEDPLELRDQHDMGDEASDGDESD